MRHGKYALQQWAVECCVELSTLQSQLNNMSELEQDMIKMIGQEAQEEEEKKVTECREAEADLGRESD